MEHVIRFLPENRGLLIQKVALNDFVADLTFNNESPGKQNPILSTLNHPAINFRGLQWQSNGSPMADRQLLKA